MKNAPRGKRRGRHKPAPYTKYKKGPYDYRRDPARTERRRP